MPQLQDLPPELLLEVCRTLAWKDLLCLFSVCRSDSKVGASGCTNRFQQTCKSFYESQTARFLWTSGLNQQIDYEGIPPATWNTALMSAPEVLRTVSRPFRFDKTITRDLSEELLCTRIQGVGEVHSAEIIPGGRCLVTVLSHRGRRHWEEPPPAAARDLLRIWDLHSMTAGPDSSCDSRSATFTQAVDPIDLRIQADAEARGAMIFLHTRYPDCLKSHSRR